MKFLLTTLTLILFIMPCWAEYQFITLRAQQGNRIDVVYSISQLGGDQAMQILFASPLYINVHTKHINEEDKVKVVFINHARPDRICSGTNPKPYTAVYTKELNNQYPNPVYNGEMTTDFKIFDNDPNKTLFSANVNIPIYAQNACDVRVFDQELAIEINGEWLVDPISGTHNFKFQLYNPFGPEFFNPS